MCILWRETAALIWESQMEAPLWLVGRQPWQFCSEQHPAVSFLPPLSCPLVSCQGHFSFYLGYSAVKYPWADCVVSLYIWPQISAFRKGLSSQLNMYCAVKIHLFKWTVPWVSANAQCLMSITQPHANFPGSSLQSTMSQPFQPWLQGARACPSAFVFSRMQSWRNHSGPGLLILASHVQLRFIHAVAFLSS